MPGLTPASHIQFERRKSSRPCINVSRMKLLISSADAAAYYPKPFATATKTTFNGFEAVKTGNIYILFTKVSTPPTNELTGPQTSVWHFGWNTPDSRKYDQDFRAK